MTNNQFGKDDAGANEAPTSRVENGGGGQECENGLGVGESTRSDLDALHGAEIGKSGHVPTRAELAAQVADLIAKGPRMSPTMEDRLALAVSITVRGYELERAWRMLFKPSHPEYVEDDDGALQMLARHRLPRLPAREQVDRWQEEWMAETGKAWGDAIAWGTAKLIADRLDNPSRPLES